MNPDKKRLFLVLCTGNAIFLEYTFELVVYCQYLETPFLSIFKEELFMRKLLAIVMILALMLPVVSLASETYEIAMIIAPPTKQWTNYAA